MFVNSTVSFVNNKASNGAAIYAQNSTVTFTDTFVRFSNNRPNSEEISLNGNSSLGIVRGKLEFSSYTVSWKFINYWSRVTAFNPTEILFIGNDTVAANEMGMKDFGSMLARLTYSGWTLTAKNNRMGDKGILAVDGVSANASGGTMVIENNYSQNNGAGMYITG
jgi:predicted outer membrane repeat protein